tara:strand:+ start:596 stop:1687 length:1092 start_codon:yes stop_codon:yes gene_type:complete
MENTTNLNGEIKKKRGRKKKITTIDDDTIENPVIEKIPKKRGRKPKGGKIINNPSINSNDNISITNIILHLKCALDDLNYNNNNNEHIICDPIEYIPNPPPDIMTYKPANNDTFSNYNENVNNENVAYNNINNINNNEVYTCNSCKNTNNVKDTNQIEQEDDDNIDIKDINTKLKQIKLQLYKNTNPDKKSACFWCTYDYDNPSCYIPKYEINDETCGYGSFCRPECAVAYLLKENIDDTMKFERYHLLNKIYSKVYNYNKNIKPAPDPHYILDKFYGNLNIQEYRKLMKTEHMLLVIEKPMTRILPELHENTDDMDNIGIHGSKMNNNANNTKQSGVYKVKRQSEKQKGPTKNEIMKENFGF